MLNKVLDDLYSYLKPTFWGKSLIFFIVLLIVAYAIWNSLTPTLKENILSFFDATDDARPVTADSKGSEKRFSNDEMVFRNLVINTCRGVPDPRKYYELARGLDSLPARDAEYASLVVDAVCTGDEKFALELLAKVGSTGNRDSAVKQVATVYIRKNQLADAARWIALLSHPQDKEWWTHRILSESRESK